MSQRFRAQVGDVYAVRAKRGPFLIQETRVEEDAKRRSKFIGFVEPYDYGWRASFRTLKPGEVFSQEGDSEVFAKEAEAVKWLHTQASQLGFPSIDIRRKPDP